MCYLNFRLRFIRECSKCVKEHDLFFFFPLGDIGICSDCADEKRVFKAKNTFYNRIWELGGRVLGEWKGNNVPVKCECLQGHKCSPRPINIRNGQGVCRVCAKRDPTDTENNFKKAILKLGGKVLGKYSGNHIPIKCLCSKGHECNPQPSNITSGQGMCLICAEKDSSTAEQHFRNAITDQGGKVIGEYQRNNTPIECECPRGHKCSPCPNSIRIGQGMCSSCGLRSEPLCRHIFEEVLQCQMSKARPAWLFWKNNRPLELDGYNEQKKIAFEYQGAQHDVYIPHFHRNGPEDLKDQQERDAFKVRACADHGVRLIIIPCIYTYHDPDNMKRYILTQLTKDQDC